MDDEDLKPRDRSLLNLGMIACLGRMHEFEAHFRGALRNGLTPKELSAMLRQVAIYCGFPAAVDATAWPSRCWRRKPRRPDRERITRVAAIQVPPAAWPAGAGASPAAIGLSGVALLS